MAPAKLNMNWEKMLFLPWQKYCSLLMPEKIGCKSDDIRPMPMYHAILEMGDDAESDEHCFMENFHFQFWPKKS